MSLAPLFTGTTGLEAQLLLATFVLCSLIGFERQTRQKSAGYRTHVLVGLGACAFTLVSGYGFAFVLGDDVRLDPSRIAAQVVSGIGFIGAGVIFKGRDVVRGLTTAATIWQAAAVGMACGAGMLSLAIFLTILHLVTLFVVAPLVRRIPTSDRKRFLRITYQDGRGILRDVLSVANTMGFAASIQRTDRVTVDGSECVAMDVRFIGKSAVRDLIPPLMDLAGVENISLRDSDDDEGRTPTETAHRGGRWPRWLRPRSGRPGRTRSVTTSCRQTTDRACRPPRWRVAPDAFWSKRNPSLSERMKHRSARRLCCLGKLRSAGSTQDRAPSAVSLAVLPRPTGARRSRDRPGRMPPTERNSAGCAPGTAEL